MAIFPEGTRNNAEDPPILPFKKGAFILAKHTGAPLIPLAIYDAGRLWPSGSYLPRPGRILVAIGQPLKVSSRDPLATVAQRAGETLTSLYLELRRQAQTGHDANGQKTTGHEAGSPKEMGQKVMNPEENGQAAKGQEVKDQEVKDQEVKDQEVKSLEENGQEAKGQEEKG
jgi:hypothetical protein